MKYDIAGKVLIEKCREVLLEYRTRHMLKLRLPAISCIMLLKESGQVQDHYRLSENSFRKAAGRE
jgi:hypothetical protein